MWARILSKDNFDLAGPGDVGNGSIPYIWSGSSIWLSCVNFGVYGIVAVSCGCGVQAIGVVARRGVLPRLGDIAVATLFADDVVISLTGTFGVAGAVTAFDDGSGVVGAAVANLALIAVGLGSVAAARGVAVNCLGCCLDGDRGGLRDAGGVPDGPGEDNPDGERARQGVSNFLFLA